MSGRPIKRTLRDDASNVASTASSSVLRYHETMVRDVARPPSSASNRSEPRSLLASETRPPVSPDSSSSSGSNWCFRHQLLLSSP